MACLTSKITVAMSVYPLLGMLDLENHGGYVRVPFVPCCVIVFFLLQSLLSPVSYS